MIGKQLNLNSCICKTHEKKMLERENTNRIEMGSRTRAKQVLNKKKAVGSHETRRKTEQGQHSRKIDGK